jgi:hypothetical protein
MRKQKTAVVKKCYNCGKFFTDKPNLEYSLCGKCRRMK